ncbi:MAG TPA: CHASE3 domain-containing protein [Opitutaceae bacterium]|nr:CHASE3 domain-containing protein [Opitutaceae bacterium]
MDRAIRRILLFFGLISAVLVGVAVVAVRNINRSAAGADWVNHTHAVILEINGAVSDGMEAEGDLRTYVMTGDPRDRGAARQDLARMDEHLATARALTRREPAQNAEVQALADLEGRREALDARVMAARAAGADAAERVLVAGEGDEASLAAIRQAAGKLTDEEMQLLAERDTVAYVQAETTRWTVWIGVAVDVALLLGVAWVIRDALAARRRAERVLQDANAQLEDRVRQRTAELQAANQRLTTENLERRWANQALEHQLRYNLLIVNSISDAVFVLTKVLNISRINPAVVHLTGWEAQDLVNRPLTSVVRLEAGAGSEPLVDPLNQALKEGRDLRDQAAVAEDRRGRKVNVSLTLYPLQDKDKVVGGIVILRPREAKASP